MSLDSITLYFVATMVAALLGAMLVFFGSQESNPALKWWGAAYLLGAASVALWTIAGERLGEMYSLALNAVGFLACGMVWTLRACSTAVGSICRGSCSARLPGSRQSCHSIRTTRRCV
jgi:hypothetical protein